VSANSLDVRDNGAVVSDVKQGGLFRVITVTRFLFATTRDTSLAFAFSRVFTLPRIGSRQRHGEPRGCAEN
jgi:hypothetical protein